MANQSPRWPPPTSMKWSTTHDSLPAYILISWSRRDLPLAPLLSFPLLAAPLLSTSRPVAALAIFFTYDYDLRVVRSYLTTNVKRETQAEALFYRFVGFVFFFSFFVCVHSYSTPAVSVSPGTYTQGVSFQRAGYVKGCKKNSWS